MEVEEFGTFYILDQPVAARKTSTLLKCSSCKKVSYFDSREIREGVIMERTRMSKENMRTITVNLNGMYTSE